MTELLQTQERFYQPSEAELIRFAEEAGCCGGETLKPLKGGHHNVVHRYGDVVTRYPKNPESAEALKAEFAVLEMLNGKGMPQALGYAEIAGTPVALIEFIDGKHKDFNELDPGQVEAFVRAMVDLHSITSDRFSDTSGAAPTRVGTHADYLQAMVRESVISRLEKLEADDCDFSAYAGAEQLIWQGVELLNALLAAHPDDFSGRKFSLLHHDLNFQNVFWKPDGTVVFIDPNPTYGDPCDDVNYAIIDNQGSAEFQRQLLEAYGKLSGGDAISDIRIEAYTLKNRLDDLVWAIAMCEQNPQNPEYVGAYEYRLAALRQLLETV